jgi:hypothetical protein
MIIPTPAEKTDSMEADFGGDFRSNSDDGSPPTKEGIGTKRFPKDLPEIGIFSQDGYIYLARDILNLNEEPSFPIRSKCPHTGVQSAPFAILQSQLFIRNTYIKTIQIFSHHDRARRRREALVPPNPKELERTVLMGRSFATFATRSMSHPSEGESRFKVGGAI